MSLHPLRGWGQGGVGETRAELRVLEASAGLRLVPLSGFITVPQSREVGQGVGADSQQERDAPSHAHLPHVADPSTCRHSHRFLCLEVDS